MQSDARVKVFTLAEHDAASQIVRKVYDLSRESLRSHKVSEFLTSEYMLSASLQKKASQFFGTSFIQDIKYVFHTACRMRTYTVAGRKTSSSVPVHVEYGTLRDALIAERETQNKTSQKYPTISIYNTYNEEVRISNLLMRGSSTLYVAEPQSALFKKGLFGNVRGSYLMVVHMVLKWMIAEHSVLVLEENMSHAYSHLSQYVRDFDSDQVGRLLKLHIMNSFILSVYDCGQNCDEDTPWNWKKEILKDMFLDYLGSAATLQQVLENEIDRCTSPSS